MPASLMSDKIVNLATVLVSELQGVCVVTPGVRVAAK